MSGVGNNINHDPDYHYIARDDIANKCQVQQEKHHPDQNDETILEKIIDGVKDVADSFVGNKPIAVTDALNKPGRGQADLIATDKKSLQIGEKIEREKEMGKPQ